MNTNSNAYTFMYSSVMVIAVAAILAFTAFKLQPIQDKNIRVEKMQNILQSVGITSTKANAEADFAKYITAQMTVDSKGNEKKEVKPFDVNLKTEFKKKEEDRNLPVFIATLQDGSIKTIIPLRGKGLWGPIWGYISLNDDYNTIFGAIFDHKSETPGLGAEISKPEFSNQLKEKKLFEGEKLVSISVYKGGKGAAKLAGDITHGIDAISGGTITSRGVESMMKESWFFSYNQFLLKNKK